MIVKNKNIRFRIGEEQTVLLICMGIALVFWVFVKLSKTYQTTRPVHVEYMLPPGKDFAGQPVSAIRATFTGHGWELLLKYLFRKPVTITFDLSEHPDPEIQREELMRRIEESASLKVIDINRNYLSVLLDTTSTRKVPVMLDNHIHFAKDFNVKDTIVLNPDSIVIWGPAHVLRNIDHVLTEPVSASALRSDYQKTVKLVQPEQTHIRLNQRVVEVFIPVEQFTEKEFTIPIQKNKGQDSIRFLPAQVQVTCTVGLSRYELTTAADFVIEANLNAGNIQSGQNTVALIITKYPSQARSIRFSPNSVEYFIMQ